MFRPDTIEELCPKGDKFHNGNYVDHGPTVRRHVLADHLEFIGKEANRWEEQFFLGVDPEAQVVYGTTLNQEALLAQIREYARAHGVAALANAAGVSARAAGSAVRGQRTARVATLTKLVRGGAFLDDRAVIERREMTLLLERVRDACRVKGLRALAYRCGVSPSHLSDVLSGRRQLSAAMENALRAEV